jgi:type IV pilus assembly protein PilQ
MEEVQKMKEGGEQAKPRIGRAEKGKRTEELVTLKFKDTNLRDVILYLAEFAGLNVVFDAGVQGVVTCDLQDMPWNQALDLVLGQNRMEKVIADQVLWVAPIGRPGRWQSQKKKETIENEDLKRVLDELNSLWNFATYEVDGPSFLW